MKWFKHLLLERVSRWRPWYEASYIFLNDCSTLRCFCLCKEPVKMLRRSTGRFSTVVQTDKNVSLRITWNSFGESCVFFFFSFSSILGILMTYLCGVLVLASSICWLMRQLASIMFFLLHLLIITPTFCPSEPLLMMLYFVQHDRLPMRIPVCFQHEDRWKIVSVNKITVFVHTKTPQGSFFWRGMVCEHRTTHKNRCLFIAKPNFQLSWSFLYGGPEGQNTTTFAKTQWFQKTQHLKCCCFLWNVVFFGCSVIWFALFSWNIVVFCEMSCFLIYCLLWNIIVNPEYCVFWNIVMFWENALWVFFQKCCHVSLKCCFLTFRATVLLALIHSTSPSHAILVNFSCFFIPNVLKDLLRAEKFSFFFFFPPNLRLTQSSKKHFG